MCNYKFMILGVLFVCFFYFIITFAHTSSTLPPGGVEDVNTNIVAVEFSVQFVQHVGLTATYEAALSPS